MYSTERLGNPDPLRYFCHGMNSYRCLVIVLFTAFAQLALGQANDRVIKDLRGEWLIQEHNAYRKYDNEEVRTVYFSLEAGASKGDYLRVADDEPFGIFINQQLVAERDRGRVTLRVDSLASLYSSPMLIGIFQKNGITSLSTTRVAPVTARAVFDERLVPRKGNFFLDFALIAALLVCIYLVFLMGTNPKLTFDYLNASKLFSVQEREENLLASRVTSRVNLLFYLFCSVFLSLTLLIAFHLAGDLIPLAHQFPIRTTGEGFLQWLKLSFIMVCLLAMKMVIVFVFSELFNIKDAAAIQHFHFIRALILAAGLITVISLVNFIFKGEGAGLHYILLKMGAGVLALSAVMMYLKLLGMTRYHFFHLFSYLCASEIIPLVILLKVLLY